MYFALNPFRTIARASFVKEASAFSKRTPKLNRAVIYPLYPRQFSTGAQKETPKAAPVPRGTFARQMRYQCRINLQPVQLVSQRDLRRVAARAYRAGRSSRPGIYRKILSTFLSMLLVMFYYSYSPEARPSSVPSSPQGQDGSQDQDGSPQDQDEEKDVVEEFL
ncbi:hypothetical protein OPT61_g8044 [Boeremia exigua]|uniref:Uncharacterized protein n=1 Tax=Boeremia exigua TaxID=749465 RepID=A0ACC2I059_9PLEO|nr:hypothetical protein OPT61_g8044 [Boeremia exigua]